MSTDSGKKKILKLRRFSVQQLRAVEDYIGLGLSYDEAINSFLDKFPETFDAYKLNKELTREEREALTPEKIEIEIREALRKKMQMARRDKNRNSYHEIKKKKEMIASLVENVPILNPIHRARELEVMRQDPSLTIQERIKVHSAAIREVDRLIPRETRSLFRPSGTVGLPDLPMVSGQTQEGQQTTSDEQKPPDPFGGAMLKKG